MDLATSNDGFYETLPRIASFADLTRTGSYTPLPDGWVIGTADIVGSTQKIAEGQYRMVNMIGASVISSQINASSGKDFPFVFGGDGATFACDPAFAAESARTLGIVKRWADEEFGLKLRTAQIPVADIRAAGKEVSVARFQASSAVDYAMFSGGGLSWAEARMKAGEYAVRSASKGAIPDLTGLSCRWTNAKAQNGMILSVVIEPTESASPGVFADVAGQVVELVEKLNRGGHPVPLGGTKMRWPPLGLGVEAHGSYGNAGLMWRKFQLLAESLVAWFFFRTGFRAGDFDPAHYTKMVSNNADFRKFDDGLKMTLDCDDATHQQIRSLLEQARQHGTVRYGLFQQDEAMVTCFVPSITQDDHIHLIDGASGGYTQAAAQMKSSAT